jgi:ketosteroid isomerase-like protein
LSYLVEVNKMEKLILACAVAAALCGVLAAADQNEVIAREILAMERKAMDGWLTGNPDPTLAILDPEITYFHAVTDKRLDGLPAVKALFEGYRGRPLFDSYEMAEPKVQANGDTAVLTYFFVWRLGTATTRWNSTQVYQRKKEGWRIIHSHWSVTKPSAP